LLNPSSGSSPVRISPSCFAGSRCARTRPDLRGRTYDPDH
jgi:hypothetical protein